MIDTRNARRAEKRRLHNLLNPRVPSTLLLQRLMVAEGAITALQAKQHLDCELQSARNAVCQLVRRGFARVKTSAEKGVFATYEITDSGRAYVADADMQDALNAADEIERELLLDQLERGQIAARVKANIERARHSVPRSVFDLGRCMSQQTRGGANA